MAPVSLGVSEGEMAELVKLARDRRVLEVGTWKGASALAMAAVAHSVLTIDHHHGDEHTGPADTLAEFLDNLRQSGYEDRVSAVVGLSWEVLPQLQGRGFGFVFIDGGHGFANALIDCSEAARLCAPGGHIAVHDWTLFGVTPAATQALGRPSWITERLAVYRWLP